MTTLTADSDQQVQRTPGALPAIHIWRICLAPVQASPQCLENILTPAEQARAARFRFAHDRARWVRTRGIVRMLLGRYTQCAPPEVPLTTGAHGKPGLTPGFRAGPLHFSWSHTDDLALLAVTEGGEVGVDVERIRPGFDPLLLGRSVFSADELACLRNEALARRKALFFTFWTGREAILKALGTGFGAAPAEFSVDGLAHRDTVQTQGMTVRSLPLGGGHAAAVAAFGKDPQICRYDWHD